MAFSISKDREIPKTPHTYSNQKRGRCRVISLNDLCLSCLENVPKIFSKMVVQNGDETHGIPIRKKKHHQTSPSNPNQKVEDRQGNATPFAVDRSRTLGVPTPPSIAQESKDLGPCQQILTNGQASGSGILEDHPRGLSYPL